MIILADEANQSTREGYTNELYHLNWSPIEYV